MRRLTSLLVILVLALWAVSCGSSTGIIPLDGQLSDPHAKIHSGGISIIGYVTSDGEYHAFESRVVQRGDSLEITASPHDFTRQSPAPERRVLATSEVTTLFHSTSGAVAAKSAGWSFLLVSVAVVGLAVIFLAAAASSGFSF